MFNKILKVLCRFFLTVKKNYRPVAYHNWRHGFNVMASMYAMLTVNRNFSFFFHLININLNFFKN